MSEFLGEGCDVLPYRTSCSHCADPALYNEVVIHVTTEVIEEFVRSINRGGHLRDDGSRLQVSVQSYEGPSHITLTFTKVFQDGAA